VKKKNNKMLKTKAGFINIYQNKKSRLGVMRRLLFLLLNLIFKKWLLFLSSKNTQLFVFE